MTFFISHSMTEGIFLYISGFISLFLPISRLLLRKIKFDDLDDDEDMKFDDLDDGKFGR